MRIMFAGGGTGGHVYPALAAARYIREAEPESEILFVGTERGMESRLVPAAGFALRTITVRGLARRFSTELVRTAWDFSRGSLQAYRILNDYDPHVVIGTGGYVSGPVLMVARFQGRRTLIHEQNILPGVTNRLLSYFAHRVCISFRASRNYFSRRVKVTFTGNPRASEVFIYDKEKAFALLGLDPDKKTIVVVGGSRGARRINEVVNEYLEQTNLPEKVQLLYLTGERFYEDVCQRLFGENSINRDNLKVLPYLKDMPAALAVADLIVSRSGATVLAEITAKGIPAILIPSPNVTGDHQTFNAKLLVNRNAAILLPEEGLSGHLLSETIERVFRNPQLLGQMAECARELGTPNAGQRFHNCIKAEFSRRKR